VTDRPATTILVVDDREENRMIVRYLFDGADYRVLEAADGTAALDLARREAPDCILLDLSMPGLSGFEVLERLQADARSREIPVIILTATDDTVEAMERALSGGAVDYITKPISPPRVAVRVRAVVERRRLQRDLRELHASFTSMLVHDLRSPLTLIKGYTELLLTGNDPVSDKQGRYLRSMANSCARMIRLIGDILDVSKLEAGKLSLQPKPIDLGALVEDGVEQMRPVAAQKAIKLSVTGAADLPPVSADPHRLEQVLSNLLSNALKFTPEHGAITVEMQRVGADVEVAVGDTGPGIPAHEMPLLFEKFSQTSSGRSAGTAGTGLGLLICRHLIEAHGGRIWAESNVGRGSRFVFRIPIQATDRARDGRSDG
jgi:two-component system sensor histidine kinase/response regulator